MVCEAPGHSGNVPKYLLGEIWLPENTLEGRDTIPHNGSWATEMKTKKSPYQIKIDFLIPKRKKIAQGLMTSQRSHCGHGSSPDTLEFSVTAVLRMVSSLVEFGEVGGTSRSLWKVSLLERYVVSLITESCEITQPLHFWSKIQQSYDLSQYFLSTFIQRWGGDISR